MNRISRNPPVTKNYRFEGEFPDIRPPEASVGRTDWGDCLILAGTESFTPVSVRTEASLDSTQVGQIIYTLPINPTLLISTRLSQIATNYEKWYPRKLMLEFVPQGSALDPGALISIPVLDPADSFTGVSGNDAIRRALAYETSVAFNIYDHATIVLPEAELEEPYFVIPGSEARQEISHIWYLMAQSTFPPRTTETDRVLGWFKLHYVVEFYEPRIPEIINPMVYSYSTTTSGIAIATMFGADLTAGAIMIGNSDLLFPNNPINVFSVELFTNWTTLPGSLPITVSDGERTFSLLAGTILYMREEHDYTPLMNFYSNINDCFNSNNALTFTTDYSAATFTVCSVVSTALWI